MRRFFRENGLSIVMLSAFAVALLGQSLAGWVTHAAEQETHGKPLLGYGAYLSTGHFWESVFENWESEFLQMGAYVVLLVRLRQKGSSESRKLEGDEPVDEDPRKKQSDPDAPWPVRRGGWVLRIYERSLALAFVLLFLGSFVLHGLTGLAKLNEEHLSHGEPTVSFGEYVLGAEFWYESLQNWQSEFLAVAALVVLTIFLRQRGSPQSKPVAAPHSETGR